MYVRMTGSQITQEAFHSPSITMQAPWFERGRKDVDLDIEDPFQGAPPCHYCSRIGQLCTRF
jgi:hypothetical protein